MADKGGRSGRKPVIALVLVTLVVVGLAWYDGGEEPLRPIVQQIAVPEGQ